MRFLTQGQAFALPPGIEISDGPKGLRFRGSATALLRLSEKLRALAGRADGTWFRLPGVWSLGVSNSAPLLAPEKLVALPPDAWNVVASKFAEVATGWEETPFDFAGCGFLWPPPEPDIGVELVGPPTR